MPDSGYFKKRPQKDSIETLIKYLKANQLIEEATLESPQVLTVKRKNKRNLRVHLTNTYIVGDADAHEILSEDPDVEAIVTMSQWNGYTDSAKASCKDRGVGLFKFGEFLGAVYYDGDEFLDYSPPSAEEREERNRRRRR
jgi:hypothetical protein